MKRSGTFACGLPFGNRTDVLPIELRACTRRDSNPQPTVWNRSNRLLSPRSSEKTDGNDQGRTGTRLHTECRLPCCAKPDAPSGIPRRGIRTHAIDVSDTCTTSLLKLAPGTFAIVRNPPDANHWVAEDEGTDSYTTVNSFRVRSRRWSQRGRTDTFPTDGNAVETKPREQAKTERYAL